MSLIIKGMEMPENCFDCPIFDNFCQERCGVTGTLVYGEIDPQRETLPDCPLVPIPEGHGRLIDADALIRAMFAASDGTIMRNTNIDGWPFEMRYADIKRAIKNVPTIIPAEGGGE